ncbi:MAG: serine protease [Crocinitomix sp.]|nr:serine protease [Crocinitomix sp.]
MKYLLFLALFSISFLGQADEGMYLPFQLKKNKKDMKAAGLELSTKEIFNPKKPSVKDAIVSFGGYCTGEIISSKGLILTNHHCGYDAIRENATPEDDILTNGFWAKNSSEEKPIAGLTASIVVEIKDVTKTILKSLNGDMTPAQRKSTIRELSAKLSEAAVDGTHYVAEVKSFYAGTEFYLFIYEVFRDVRLVGAPPSAIGKYGGNTDNWMWERHTGDFSMFRIYANASNEPADFAMDNKAYAPKHHLPISLDGVEENDFAMIMGYPGSTDRFLTSYGIDLATEKEQPNRVKIRAEKLRIMKEDMDASDAVRLQYASKYAQVSNYWKYFIGQTEQLKNNKVGDRKKGIEKAFTDWVNEKPKRQTRYGNVLKDFEDAYTELEIINDVQVYFFEAVYSVDFNKFMLSHIKLYRTLSNTPSPEPEVVKAITDNLKTKSDAFYESVNMETELKLISATLQMYFEDVPSSQRSTEANVIYNTYDKSIPSLVAEISGGLFANQANYEAFLDDPTLERMENSDLFVICNGLMSDYMDIANGPMASSAKTKLVQAKRLFIEALREMDPKKKFYPDANSTLRLSFGNVLPYTSIQGKTFKHYTTMEGLMAKEDPNNEDFIVPSKLKELYEKKDYGRYGTDGDLRVNFITNNDITGGNSGSPVMNSKGELIGCAFDGNWESMSGDISFEEDFQRTICVDIRYILFVIDKYAGASHIVDEMTIAE